MSRTPGEVLMEFCDLTCRYARFPEEEGVDGAGSCRTFAALYCAKKKRYVHKNMPCAERAEKERGRSPGSAARGSRKKGPQ